MVPATFASNGVAAVASMPTMASLPPGPSGGPRNPFSTGNLNLRSPGPMGGRTDAAAVMPTMRTVPENPSSWLQNPYGPPPTMQAIPSEPHLGSLLPGSSLTPLSGLAASSAVADHHSSAGFRPLQSPQAFQTQPTDLAQMNLAYGIGSAPQTVIDGSSGWAAQLQAEKKSQLGTHSFKKRPGSGCERRRKKVCCC
eukprot:TRINITY_DN32755_c1_g1_i2.p1 TRINITY_DN32755_c1_g1~~TRINITY_DN32755_c1_g1_i2.p1  ORF type:complete len:209 (+),score=31.18 TRINITY_DN32755_c1_g1_i2:40-627(+)